MGWARRRSVRPFRSRSRRNVRFALPPFAVYYCSVEPPGTTETACGSLSEGRPDPTVYIRWRKPRGAGYASMTSEEQRRLPVESGTRKYPYTMMKPRVPARKRHRASCAAALGASRRRAGSTSSSSRLPIRPRHWWPSSRFCGTDRQRVGLRGGHQSRDRGYELIGVPSPSAASGLTSASRSSAAATGEYFEIPRRFSRHTKTKDEARSDTTSDPVGATPSGARRAARAGWWHGGGDPEELDRPHSRRVSKLREEDGKKRTFEIT